MEQVANYQGGHNGKGKRSAWATFVSWDKPLLVFVLVALFSAFAALFVLLTPVLDFILDFMGLHFAGWIEWESWIMAGDRGLIIGAVLGLIALFFALLARFRVRRNYSVYAEAGCPQCHEHELIRVRRNRRDRFLSFLGVPVRRYSCRNCTWHGVRLAGYRHGKTAAATEESDVDVFDAEDNNVVLPIKLEGESSPAAEVLTAPVSAAEIMVMEEVTEDTGEMDLVVLAEPSMVETEPSMVEQPLNEQSFEFVEAAVIENAVHEEAPASDVFDEEDVEDADVDDESSSEEAEVEPLPEQGEAYDEVQSAGQEELVDGEDGTETNDEDDEFARLCLEVARSKK